MRILDRYILKNFLVTFLYCFLGFLSIWLVFDIADKSNELRSQPALMLLYYETQIPRYIVLMLPIVLLLSLLYSLARMSRSNEIISMLAAGQSIYRITIPFIFVGIAVAALSFSMNYKLAPHADAAKNAIFDQLDAKREQAPGKAAPSRFKMDSILFRNRAESRTWYLQLKTEVLSPYERAAHPDLDTVQSVHITQQDAQGNIVAKYYASRIAYDPFGKAWTLFNGETVNFDENGDVATQEKWESRKFKEWGESPWRIFSANLDAQNFSLPELRNYLRLNSDMPPAQLAPYRTYANHLWADSLSCLVVVFVAVPLGIVYTRRGVLAGVAGAVFLFFGMMIVDKLFLVLGKHSDIPPLLGAWGNDIIFGIIGLVLLYMRNGNREFFKLNRVKRPRSLKPA